MLIFSVLENAYEPQRNDVRLDGYLAAIAQGDHDALSALYSQTSASVYGLTLSILKNTWDAEDALHDCYVDVFRAAGSYRPQGKPLAWILTIARNRCLMNLRERKRSADLPGEDWERYLEETPAVTPEDRLTLAACMNLLGDAERQIVLLHAVSGLKHREIAEVLHCPLPTVLSKYHRALKKLKDALTKGEER